MLDLATYGRRKRTGLRGEWAYQTGKHAEGTQLFQPSSREMRFMKVVSQEASGAKQPAGVSLPVPRHHVAATVGLIEGAPIQVPHKASTGEVGV